MSVLYIVRHGQATFFSDDYDQLSDIGYNQARLLGSYWRENGIEINEVYSGSLNRQLQTAESCGETYSVTGKLWPEVEILDGLNEYDADDVMDKLKDELVEKHEHIRKFSDDFASATEERERYRTFHRLLEEPFSVSQNNQLVNRFFFSNTSNHSHCDSSFLLAPYISQLYAASNDITPRNFITV